MNTKICRGILHPEGVELFTEEFDLVPARWITRSGENKMKLIPRHICKKCRRVTRRRYNRSHLAERTKYNKLWCGTEAGRTSMRRANHKYYHSHVEERINTSKRLREELSPGYLNTCLVSITRSTGLKANNFTNKIRSLKKLQLILYREIKKKAS